MSNIIRVHPLDQEGIRFDRPSHEVFWQKLTNVLFKDGSIVPRPGFLPHGDSGDLDTFELSPPLYITQIKNAGSVSGNREAWTQASETVRPDASADLVAGWSGDHTDIDETPPDGVDSMQSDTVGAKKEIEFAAMSNTYASIFGVILRGRARMIKSGSLGQLKFTINDTAEIATLDFTGDAAETLDWFEFAIPVGTNLSADAGATPCTKFDDDTLDAFTFEIEVMRLASTLGQFVGAASDGVYSQWKNAEDGSTALFSDVEPPSGLFLGGGPDEDQYDGIVPSFTGSGADAKQSFMFTLGDNFDSIDTVSFVAFTTKGDNAEPIFELYWRSAGGDETLIDTFKGKVGNTSLEIRSDIALNPDTGAAWDQADLEAGEFFVKCIIGGSGTEMHSIGLNVIGLETGGTAIQIDYLALDIIGATTSQPGTGVVEYTRLFSNKANHFRVDNDVAVDYTDITNSVAFTGLPAIPLDYATLYGQLYVVNGKDATRVYPTVANVYTSLTANGATGNKMTGRTVASFANRILYGWFTDNTSVQPEGVAYSKFNDGSTHNHVSSGTFHLLDTPGGVVKLIQLNEDVLAALKEEGVYNIIKTGQAAFPFRRDVIDFETGCIAKMSAKRVTLKDGSPAIIFLGQNPSKGGLNVFLFDGQQVVPVGDPIVRKLEEEATKDALQFAFAEVDPITGTYWLFFAEECSGLLPNSAYVMDVNSFSWTRAEFPFFMSCAGQWNIYLDGETSTGQRPLSGERTFMLGSERGVPYYASYDFSYDRVGPLTAGTLGAIAFLSTLETGDLLRPQDKQVASYRIHMELTIQSLNVDMRISSSVDGGKTFNTEVEKVVGLDDTFVVGKKKYLYFDMTPSHENMVRYKVEIGPDPDEEVDTLFPMYNLWQIDDFRIEMVPTGDGA